jgi:poly-gamma-glutamate capsule biosynthesis protein CapA/YwtB (metallophosphatase superfamily)
MTQHLRDALTTRPDARGRAYRPPHGRDASGVSATALAAATLAALALLAGCALGPSSQQTPARSATSTVPTITIAAVGDMQFDRGVRALVDRRGGAAPLAAIASQLRTADITVGNLEACLSDRGRPDAHKDVVLHGDPVGIDSLTSAGFDLVSLANNHIMDFGSAALRDTLGRLDRAGIAHSGAGADEQAAWKRVTVRRKGATVAFLSVTDIVHAGYPATENRAGVAALPGNEDALRVLISEAEGSADYVIVALHYGTEYADKPSAAQVAQAHRAIDAGADVVLAHHPHVIQAVEAYKNGVIAYSLGDFVFDHASRKTGETFVLQASLTPGGVRDVRILPVYISAEGVPASLEGSGAQAILKRVAAMSAARGTSIEVSGATGRVTQ